MNVVSPLQSSLACLSTDILIFLHANQYSASKYFLVVKLSAWFLIFFPAWKTNSLLSSNPWFYNLLFNNVLSLIRKFEINELMMPGRIKCMLYCLPWILSFKARYFPWILIWNQDLSPLVEVLETTFTLDRVNSLCIMLQTCIKLVSGKLLWFRNCFT